MRPSRCVSSSRCREYRRRTRRHRCSQWPRTSAFVPWCSRHSTSNPTTAVRMARNPSPSLRSTKPRPAALSEIVTDVSPESPGPEEPRRCYRSLWPGGLRLELGPGVPEAEGAVEDEPAGRRVGIRAEVAEALELHGLTDWQFGERRLNQAFLEHRLRVGVEVGVEVAFSAGIGAGEETVIDAHLGGHGVLG